MSSIQMQTVLYYNSKKNLEKSMDSIENAVRICRERGGCLTEFTLSYGDASTQPVFSEEELYCLKEKYKSSFSLKYQFFGFNAGTSRGHNVLFEDCSSEYIMTMNPDIIFAPDFFVEIMCPFEKSFLNAGMSEARQTPLEHPKEYNKKTGETSWCSGAGTVIPSRVFKEVGGYDEESFFLYCDDVDLSWRIRLLGYNGIYSPSAIIFHSKNLDFNGQMEHTDAEYYYSAESALLMAHKWSNPKGLKALINQMRNSGDSNHKKALNNFISRESNGKLPEPMDYEHKVAEFVGTNYTKHRFVM